MFSRETASTRPALAPSRLSRRKRLGFSILVALLLIAVLEIGLRVLWAVSPRVAQSLSAAQSEGTQQTSTPATVPDAQLQYRPNPQFPGHDRSGFRNREVPESAEIVALGDSQTYGVGVLPHEAWPQRLERQVGVRTYNMAFGGYGPTHSLALFDEALALHPKVVIEAMYAGNDLYDCYHMVCIRGQLPSLKSSSAQVSNEIASADARQPLDVQLKKMQRVYDGDFDEVGPEMSAEEVERFWAQVERKRRRSGPLQQFFEGHSKIYAVGKAAFCRIAPAPSDASAEEWEVLKLRATHSGGYWDVFENESSGTIFVPEYRRCGLDLSDPRIREGHRIALAAIREMDQRVRAQQAHFAVLLIPTKELVFAEFFPADQASKAYKDLVEQERQMWQETKAGLQAVKIAYVDALPALSECVREGRQPYPHNQGGHPNAVGQQAIAETVTAFLRDEVWLQQ